MEEKPFKEVDVLQIMSDIADREKRHYVGTEEIVKEVPHPYQNYAFRLLFMLEALGVIERSPGDRFSYKIVGSIRKWEPKYPETWDYDVERISNWLHTSWKDTTTSGSIFL